MKKEYKILIIVIQIITIMLSATNIITTFKLASVRERVELLENTYNEICDTYNKTDDSTYNN